MMRHVVMALCLTGLVLGVGACESEDDASSSEVPKTSTDVQAGKRVETDSLPAPDVRVETMAGESLHLAQQDGKVLLINFWATWCAPCRKEIPDLVDLYADLEEEGLVILGISVDQDGRAAVEPFAKKHEINYPIILDPDQTLEPHFEGLYGLPTTYVIDPNGRIVQRVTGIFPTEKMKPDIKAMLDADESSV